MVKSLRSCFKIIYCAGDSAKNDDGSPTTENKTSPGKRTWSFQKRSLMHHVPSSHVVSESVPIVNDKQDLGIGFDAANSEKTSISQNTTVEEQTNESSAMPLVGAPSTESEQFTVISTDKTLYNIAEDVVVIVQTSIRGYLAKRELKKIRNVVKLQAAIRRHLVRRQAVGTLRCIKAILKIQQIVRSRRAARFEEFISKEKLSEKTTTEVKSFEMKPSNALLAIRKLASNSFASQLLKSTLETKAVHMNCNPLYPDSEWMWFERWMAFTSSDQHKIISHRVVLGEDINNDLNDCDVNNEFQVMPEHTSSHPKLVSCVPTTVRSEIEDDLMPGCSKKIKFEVPSSFQSHISNSLVQNHHLKPRDNETWLKENSKSVHGQISLISEPIADLELNNSHSNKHDFSEGMHSSSTQKEARATRELEVGQVVIESRKSINPGFAAVQAKFEELSTTSSSNKSLSNSFKDTSSDSKLANVDSKTEEGSEAKSDYLNIGDIRKEISTTTAQDRSVSEVSEIISEITASKENTLTVTSTSFNIHDTNVETNDLSCELDAVHSKNVAESFNDAASVHVKQKSEGTQLVGSTKGTKVHISSQSSPISVPVSNGTSSNLISMNAKATKTEYVTPIRQKRSQTVINNSPTDSKNDSGEQNSGYHLRKGSRSTKRRNSFSMVKTDHEHQNSSINLLPSYMKPTESAMAKVSASISQKSSPDMHDKDNHIKKRNSLPNGDGKQGSSPRMQRSTSQVQQSSKGNGILSPQNSAEKRWLR